jgi:hypothetical protein
MGGRAAAQRAASEGHAGEERTASHDHSEKVPSKFFLLYHFFITSFTFHSLLFHFPQQFPLNTPSIPTTTIKYHFLYLLFIRYQFFIY